MSDYDPYTIDIEPKLSADIDTRHTGASNSVCYFNATGVPIYVTTRNNITTKIDPTFLNNQSGNFIIRSTHTYEDNGDILINPNQIKGDELAIYHEAAANIRVDSFYENRRNDMSLNYDSVLTLEQLNQSKRGIYVRNLDILISLQNTSTIVHPYSSIAKAKKFLIEEMKKKEKMDMESAETRVTFRLIDNTNTLGRHYISYMGTVYALNPIKDIEAKNGIYMIENKFVKGTDNKLTERVRFTDLKEHNIDHPNPVLPLIYSSYQDAVNAPDRREIEKLKNDRMEMELKQKELEYRENKRREQAIIEAKENEFKENELLLKERILQLEKEKKIEEDEMERRRREGDELLDEVKRNYQIQLTKEKHRIAKLELDMKRLQSEITNKENELKTKEMKHREQIMKMKEDFEKNAYQRKNGLEILKSAPVIVTGLATLAGFFIGSKK